MLLVIIISNRTRRWPALAPDHFYIIMNYIDIAFYNKDGDAYDLAC